MLGWSAFDLLLLYWLENGVAGAFTVPWMLRAERVDTGRGVGSFADGFVGLGTAGGLVSLLLAFGALVAGHWAVYREEFIGRGTYRLASGADAPGVRTGNGPPPDGPDGRYRHRRQRIAAPRAAGVGRPEDGVRRVGDTCASTASKHIRGREHVDVVTDSLALSFGRSRCCSQLGYCRGSRTQRPAIERRSGAED